MKTTSILLFICLLVTSCNQPSNKSDKKTSSSDVITKVELADILKKPDKFNGKQIKVQGLVTHVCKHGGQKLFIMSEDPDKQIRINTSDDIPEFDIELEGSTVEFSGYFKKLTDVETEAMNQDTDEMHYHTGDESHAEAEKASYHLEAHDFKKI